MATRSVETVWESAKTVSESVKTISQLAVFLKFLRQRIDRDVAVLGPFVRRPPRVGKRVTQEEVAEAAKVSREWYGLLECGSAGRPSIGLLERLADVLMVTPTERAELFQLGVSDLGRVQLLGDSIAALDAFSHLRAFTKRLLAATSIDDVLTLTSEQIVDWFDGAALVQISRRREPGIWEHRGVDERQEQTTAARLAREIKERFPTPELRATLNFQGQLSNAGELGTPDLLPLWVQREVRKIYSRHRVAGLNWCYARVRSRAGAIGGLYIAHKFGYSYTATDLAVLRAVADLASLALHSG